MRRLLAVAAMVLVSSCGGAADMARPAPRDLNVLAAASLTESFTALARSYEKGDPQTRVRLDFGGSPTLVQQIEEGAPADVFASADQPNMQKLIDANAVESPSVFAGNRLEIVVQRGNPKHIEDLSDLARPNLIVVLAAPTVPAGNYAAEALQKASVKLTPKSQEQDVKAVVSKVSLGEADAGIVYVTDVRAGGNSVEGVPIPDEQNVVARYPIAVLKTASSPVAATMFEKFVLGAEGQRILASYGFSR